MQLVIDIGNTRVKAAIFDDKKIAQTYVFNSTTELIASGIIEKNTVKHCIVASVVDDIEPFIALLKEKTTVLFLKTDTPTPVKNLYKTPDSLGGDRLAAAVGGNFLYSGQNLLVIDCGTCVKYNFVNNRNEFLGGAIAPGLQMRFKALNEFTARLPLLATDDNLNSLIGTNSNESIVLGVQNGIVAEVDGIVNNYREQYPDVKIVLTGGDINFFAKRLKNSIFADPNLILTGLNEILAYNINRIT